MVPEFQGFLILSLFLNLIFEPKLGSWNLSNMIKNLMGLKSLKNKSIIINTTIEILNYANHLEILRAFAENVAGVVQGANRGGVAQASAVVGALVHDLFVCDHFERGRHFLGLAGVLVSSKKQPRCNLALIWMAVLEMLQEISRENGYLTLELS